MSNSDRSPEQLVAQADRLRRGRHADRVLAMAAPIVAAIMLVLAVAGRFFGWSRSIPPTALGFAAIGLLVYAWMARRTRPTTDAIASNVDRDASLRGELRSAHWFEAQGTPDDWTQFHMQRAAERAAAVDWAVLYPAARAMKQWAGAGLMAVAVIAVSLYVPARAITHDAAAAIGDPELAAALPADIAAKLAALLEEMKKASLNKNAEQISLEEMKKLMANLDPALQKKMMDLLAKQMEQQAQVKAKELDDARPDRAENSTAGLPEDVKWALDDMASRQAQQDRQTNANNPSASTETGQQGMGSQQAEQKMSMSQAASPLMREAATDAASKMMMGGGGPMGGDSGPGAGGKKNEQTGLGNPALLAQALRKEMVEANADALGENKDKEDRRKKTEQGKSTLGYTRVAPPAAFEPSRSAAPPPVPEARRQLLLNYFIRKK